MFNTANKLKVYFDMLILNRTPECKITPYLQILAAFFFAYSFLFVSYLEESTGTLCWQKCNICLHSDTTLVCFLTWTFCGDCMLASDQRKLVPPLSPFSVPWLHLLVQKKLLTQTCGCETWGITGLINQTLDLIIPRDVERTNPPWMFPILKAASISLFFHFSNLRLLKKKKEKKEVYSVDCFEIILMAFSSATLWKELKKQNFHKCDLM